MLLGSGSPGLGGKQTPSGKLPPENCQNQCAQSVTPLGTGPDQMSLPVCPRQRSCVPTAGRSHVSGGNGHCFRNESAKCVFNVALVTVNESSVTAEVFATWICDSTSTNTYGDTTSLTLICP